MSEKTTKTLQLNFKNAVDKKTSIRLNEPEKSVDSENIKRVMEYFVESDAFQDESGDLYATAINGEEIVRTVTDIYTFENE